MANFVSFRGVQSSTIFLVHNRCQHFVRTTQRVNKILTRQKSAIKVRKWRCSKIDEMLLGPSRGDDGMFLSCCNETRTKFKQQSVELFRYPIPSQAAVV